MRTTLRRCFCLQRCLAIATVLLLAQRALAEQTLYIATTGNDAWSGTLPAPNDAKTDGPFASLTAARDAIRRLKAAQGGRKGPVRVQIRGGTYYLAETLTLGPEDSGTKECPISYEAFPGEQPVLSGGTRVSGWQPHRDKIMVALLPDVKAGKWHFRSLFANGHRQVRARCPNVDRSDLYQKGFFYADRDTSAFGLAVGCIHNPGDWMEYKVQVPADGEYGFWMYYGAANRVWGTTSMGGRTVLVVDGGKPVPLENLPDTGDWGKFQWSRAASVRLTAGEHVIRWQNVKGGGINLEAYALSDDPDWKPVATKLPKPAAQKHVILIQAEDFVRSHGKQLSVSGTAAGSPTQFFYSPGTFKATWARGPGAEVHIFQSGSCRAFMEIISIAGVDEKSRTVTVGGPECVAPLRPGDRYFVENVLEELDAPGEWYLDCKTGQLFYWPEAELSEESEVIAPRLGRLVQLLGDAKAGKPVAHVRFSGLVLQETDYSPDDDCAGYGMGNDGVIYGKDAVDCAVEQCVFRNIGKYAVCLLGGSGNTVHGNDILHGAEGGVLLLSTARNTVSDNHVHHCGEVYKHVGGVILQGAGTDENLVAHNCVHDISRYGISLKNAGLRNRIEYNRVLNTNLETCDTGGIEVTQHDRELRSGGVIAHNIVGDTIGYSSNGPEPVFMSWGIYLDSFAGGYTVTHNVTYRNSHGGIMLQGGKDNRVVNNVFVDSKTSQAYISNFAGNATGLVLERNVFYYTDPKAVLVSAGKLDEKVIRADRNVYFHAGGKEPVMRGGASTWADWQARGFDRNSLVADPLFVDAAHDNYALRPNSPALKLGFEPIDTSRVGLLRKRCRCTIRPAARHFGL